MSRKLEPTKGLKVWGRGMRGKPEHLDKLIEKYGPDAKVSDVLKMELTARLTNVITDGKVRN
jgi:hypothetical protein